MKQWFHRAVALAAVGYLALAGQAAVAQEDKAENMKKQLEARFAAADKDHDGKLSKAEAEAGMPRLAKAFDKIDAEHTGYLTLAQVEAYMAQMRKPPQ
ncbi:EF-hand domain-containing protein [Oxalobacteraceae bacterium A2-2]